ncbi:Flp pilus assembly protein CpaB [Lottiidibacillus patelloidae]|uniref:Flp pilus assembly protein CpaB n=1 Tax=Lottiidibacillus patelloidae TaxID=2670334 RepID=A0A263BWM7_9BACI|nr:Flp pilus assembly protein CpaB [Lottiidibacillus patelloidae]OZM58139.1 Flp pilus assembly protein CpaB [Lottiidibacillus patelloidae]
MNAKVTLIISLFLGAITTFMFFTYMQKQTPQPVVQEDLQPVIVAKQAISENTIITAEMVEEMLVPTKTVHPNATIDVSAIEGMVAIATIAKGETLLINHLQKVEEEEKFISRKIKEGYRAVALGVNFVQSVSNLIEPEDYVDVIATIKDDKDKLISELILEKVRVLAVDRRMVESDNNIEFAAYSSVTLELKALDAVKAINASERGNIHFIVYSKVNSKVAQ